MVNKIGGIEGQIHRIIKDQGIEVAKAEDQRTQDDRMEWITMMTSS